MNDAELTPDEKAEHVKRVAEREDAELVLAEWDLYARRLSKALKERGLPDGTQVTPTGEIVQ